MSRGFGRGACWLALTFLLFVSNCSAARRAGLEPAEAALRTGDYAAALKGYREVLASEPDSVPAQVGILRALNETGAYQEAREHAGKFIGPNPPAALLLESGRVCAAVGDYSLAEKQIQQACLLGGVTRLQAARELADLKALRGQRAEAQALWSEILGEHREGRIRGSSSLGCAAVAAWRLGRVEEAKEIFLDATDEKTSGPVSLRTLSDFGFLFLEKYNATDAIGVFRDCLRVNKAYAPALLGIALARKYESTREVEKQVRAALAVNPNLVPAINLLAELRIQEESYDAAEVEIRRALRVNPSNLESLSLLAVCHELRGEPTLYAATEAKILNINPSYGLFYHTLAENLVMRRKYHEAVERERMAVSVDPGLWAAHAGLGINLMRIGEMARGRQAIERAFKGDPFNVWAYNTLELLDLMDKFVGSRSEHFRFLMSSEDEAAVGPYARRLAEEVYEKLVSRYRFEPEGPIQVELFPDHGGFAVRTLGLPGLGALGVCFGKVIAQDSPRARKAGSFNWGSTLWHEFAHVITLQMTRHNIPRWYSEGISVYEERRARPGWGDDLTPAFVRAYKEGKLLKVSELNAGMMRPEFPEQISFSYHQAAMVCELIEERFGFEKIRETLVAFATGASSEAVFRQVLGWDADTLEQEYARFLDSRLARHARVLPSGPAARGSDPPDKPSLIRQIAASPDDFPANLRLGMLLHAEKSDLEAEPYLKKAQQLFPEYIEDGGSYRPLFEIYRAQGREDDALDQLLRWTRYDENAFEPLLRAAEIYLARGDWVPAVRLLDLANYIHPYDPRAQRKLGDAASAAREWALAALAYQALLGLDPPDPAGAHLGLARACLELGRKQEARKAVLRALEIAPTYEPAQELLLRLRGVAP
ncbi:MAG: tetratricopeptide repeat protein [Acidobacteria bacterium]|nr:tetratricopeptide repeat protein [Acidobacteriota bacterium]